MDQESRSPAMYSELAKELTIAYMEKHPRESIDSYVDAFEHFYEVVNYTAGSEQMMNVYPSEIIRDRKKENQ